MLQPPVRPHWITVLRRAVVSIRAEETLALVLAATLVPAQLSIAAPPLAIGLDLVACLAAGLSGRHPRTAAGATLAVLMLYVVAPTSWSKVGELAFLVPLLSFGAQRATTLRARYMAGAAMLLAAEGAMDPIVRSAPIPYLAFWAGLSAIAWLVGDHFARSQASLEARNQAAMDAERAELARDIHDTVAHDLAVIAWRAERARVVATFNDADLAFFAETANRCADDLRRVLSLVNPTSGPRIPHDKLRLITLPEAIANASEQLSRHGFTPHTIIEGEPDTLPPALTRVLSRCTKEASNNMVRHGDPSLPCSIIAAITSSDVELLFVNQIRTNPENTAHIPLGVTGMRERLRLVNGSLEAHPTGQQWVTRIVVPRTSPRTGDQT